MTNVTSPNAARRVLALTGLSLTTCLLCAQDDTLGEQEPFELSPFEVRSQGDSGYQRVDAGTATRISMDIQDTPLSINVVAEQFIRDTGRDQLIDIFDYSSSIDTNPDNVMRNDDIKVRGFNVSFVLRDGFKKYYNTPLEAIDRVEVVKGPNAVFFGQAQPGGVINYVTKDPLFDPYYEARVETGNDAHYKAWLDATGPITDWMAYRIVTSYEDSESWKDFVTKETKYIFSALTVRPFDWLKVTGKYEYTDTFRTGGVNTALLGNKQYFRDYYANEGRDFGYGVNWDETDLPVSDEAGTWQGFPTRYPWPVAGQRSVEPPVTGFGGINPRWDGTITPELEAFFEGNVPAAFLDWQQPDQSLFPAYQRNVKQPFQYAPIDLASAGNRGTNYEPGWRILKWFANGMEDYPDRFTGPVFPRGFNWNPNGQGSFHDTEHHIATLEIEAELLTWLNFRYGGNYLENTFLRVQQFNSDTDMDGFTLSPGQGFPFTPGGSISGAAVNEFLNNRYTHQADLVADFEIGGTTHTILLGAEVRQDEFVDYSHDRTDYFFDNVLRPERLFPDGTPRSFAYRPGVANWDIFADQPDDISKWVDLDSSKPTTTSNYLEEVGFSGSYRGTFLKEKLSVLAGLRWEERSDFFFDGNTVGELKGERLSDVTPMVGANYEIKPGLSLYASYSESFVPPSRPQGTNSVTFYEGPLDDPETRTVAVEDLGVEKGIGYEAGIKASGFQDKLSGSMTVFHLERQNIVVSDSNLIETLRQNYATYDQPWLPSLESGSSGLRKNSGVEASEGLEVDINYRARSNWTITASFSWLWKAELENPDQVDFFCDVNLPIGGQHGGPYPHPSLFSDEVLGSYTVPSSGQTIEVLRPLSASELNTARSEAAESGNAPVNPYTGEELVFEPILHSELEQVSEFRFSIWSLYELTEGRLEGLEIGLGSHFQSKQRPRQRRDLDYWNPGFWIFDAMLRYDLKVWQDQEVTLQLNVNNLFDRREIDSGSFGINAPRTWRLSATMKF